MTDRTEDYNPKENDVEPNVASEETVDQDMGPDNGTVAVKAKSIAGKSMSAQSSDSKTGQSLYRLKRLWRMYRKELRETLRDRRTLVTLLLMPLLLYPILSMALNRFMLTMSVGEQGYTVCVSSQAELDRLGQWLCDSRSYPPKAILESRGGKLAEFRIGMGKFDSVEASILANEADVGLVISMDEAGVNNVTIFSHRGDAVSQAARQILTERLHWLCEADEEYYLRASYPRYRSPVSVKIEDLGVEQKSDFLATLIPLVLVLMTITGAVYPAIDLTAGERERGTLEAVMASPVPRFSVLLSKYFAVISVATLTAIANLLAMFTTLWGSGLMSLLEQGGGMPLGMVLPMFGLLILFSLFFSAVLLALTSYARSFKEDQAFLIPVMLLSLAPAMISLVPGIELSGALIVVPLINIVLLARDLLAGQIMLENALLAIAVTIFYAGGALAVAARLFGGDAVMRTSEQSSMSLFRRSRVSTDRPSSSQAVLVLALLVPIYFVVSNGLMQFLTRFGDTVNVQWQLVLNGAALVLTFGIIPLIAVWWERCQIRSAFRVNGFAPLALVGAVFLGLGCWAFAHEAFVIADAMGIGGLGDQQIEAAQGMIEKMRQAPVWLLLLVFAVGPALIEELCFRGYFFSSLEKSLRPLAIVAVTAVVFGLFHVLTGNALLVERFIPTTMMGFVIGWVALKTSSVVPGMVIHFVHNGLLNLVLYYSDELNFLGDGFDNKKHLPLTWLIMAAAAVAVGIALVSRASSNNSESRR